MKAIVFTILKIFFFATHAVLKIEEYHLDIPLLMGHRSPQCNIRLCTENCS